MRRELSVQIAFAGSPTAASADLVWTDVSNDVLLSDPVNFQRGATSSTGGASAGSMSFTLKNIRGQWSGAALLRRPVRFRANEGGTFYELGRFHVTDVTEQREGIRRLQIAGSDVLALAGEANVGGNVDYWLSRVATVTERWSLDDEGPGCAPTIGNPVLAEVDVSVGLGTDTFGTITYRNTSPGSSILQNNGNVSVLFEPADPFTTSHGFTGLECPISPSTSMGVNFWMRCPMNADNVDDWPYYSSVPVLTLTSAADATKVRYFGYSTFVGNASAAHLGRGAVFMYGTESGAANELTLQPDDEWVNVDYSWNTTATTVLVTRTNGLVYDLSANFTYDDTLFPSGFAKVTLGGSRSTSGAYLFPGTGPCEVADVVIWRGGGSSGLAHAAIGWPGQTTTERLDRVTAEAGWPTGRLTCGTFTGPTLAGGDQDRQSLSGHVQSIEDTVLGTTIVNASGNVDIITREEWESATPSAYIPAGCFLAASDGVATNTGFLANSSTVTRKDGTTVSATHTHSRDTYGLLTDDKQLATNDADYGVQAAGWLAHNRSDPSKAYGLPNFTMLLDSLRPEYRTIPYTVDCGQLVQVNDMFRGSSPSYLRARVTGISWQIDKSGWRCTWYARPDSTPSWFQIGTDAIGGQAIIGW